MANKELYTYEEARKIIGFGAKAFQGARERGELKTIGRKVARAEIERILGHPIDGGSVNAQSDSNNERELDLKEKLYNRGFEKYDDMEATIKQMGKDIVKLIQDKREAEDKTYIAHRELKKVTDEWSDIQSKIDNRMMLCDADIARRKTLAQQQINQNIEMAEDRKNEAEALMAEARKIKKMADEKASLILQYKPRFEMEVEWYEKIKPVKSGLNDLLAALQHTLANPQKYGTMLMNLLGEYSDHLERYLKILDIEPLPNDTQPSLEILNKIRGIIV